MLFAQHASIYETVNIADGLDKPWAKKLVNAILRQIQRDKDKILTQTHYSHPTWLLIALKRLVQNTSLYQNLEGDKHQPLDLTLAPVVQL
jgi:16S rRNA (cytosine967-C5)-methyltransferase